ncbi:MAG: phosphotransferase [Myxococcota bacterium]|nr:phosphotransferase [Myxococcota bacterium]
MSDATDAPSLLPELTPVRDAHRFDEAALAEYLAKEVPGLSGPLRVQQFEGGQSNPTFRIEARIDGAERALVLRKKPPGELLKSAHQVDREYRVMTALRDTDVPVPETLVLCEDESVIGTSFYVMACVEGRVSPDALLPGLEPSERAAVYEDVIRVLAALHSVDPEAVGLGDFGRPGNYYARQVSRWSRQYEASKTSEIESMEALMRWLPENIPDSDESRIAHGDYRIGNLVLHPTEPRIVAVLDWELCTIGHPLADLAYLCMGYHGPAAGAHETLATADLGALGIPSEEQLLARYCELTGRQRIERWGFYLAFQLFRSAAIVQGVYKRGIDGNASSERARTYGAMVAQQADHAWRIAKGA